MDIKQKLVQVGFSTLSDVGEYLRVMPERITLSKEELFALMNKTDHPYVTAPGDILQEMKKDELLMHYMEAREPEKTNRWEDYYMEYCCVGVTEVIDRLSVAAKEYLKSKNILTDYDIRDQLLISDNIYKVAALSEEDKQEIKRGLDNRSCIDLQVYLDKTFQSRSAACFRPLVKHMYIHNVGLLRKEFGNEVDIYVDWPDPEESVSEAARRMKKQELIVAAGRLKFVSKVFGNPGVRIFERDEKDTIERSYTLQSIRDKLPYVTDADRDKLYVVASKYVNIDILKDNDIKDWDDIGKKMYTELNESVKHK